MNADQALDRLKEIDVRLLQLGVEENQLRDEHAKTSATIFNALPQEPDAQGVKRFSNRGTVYKAERKNVQPVDEQLHVLEGDL